MSTSDNIAAPIRIGILNDMADGPPGPSDIGIWLRRVMDEYLATGRITTPVEWIEAYGLGKPAGSVAAVEIALSRLAEQGAMLVIGPAIGDNALGVTPLVEELRVPTVHWAGAETARGEWMFQLQVGSHEEESILMARHLARRGAKGVAIIREDSPIGEKHLDYFLDEARRLGLATGPVATIDPNATEAGLAAATIAASDCDALAYMGLGMPVATVAQDLADRGWSGLRVMNSCGLRGYQPGIGSALEGWTYCDLVSDRNPTLAGILKKFGLGRERAFAAAKGWDLGVIAAEAVARASSATPEGLREGLERIKWLPAAEGAKGTLLSFGKQDRGALHGRYLVLRQWQGGRSVEIDQP